jgi:hypothetical protein
MSKFQFPLVLSYLLMTCYFFTNWLRFSFRHPSSSPEDKFLSFVMFIISTLLWPLIVPISFLEILKTRKLEFSTAIPVLVTVFTFTLLLYMG